MISLGAAVVVLVCALVVVAARLSNRPTPTAGGATRAPAAAVQTTAASPTPAKSPAASSKAPTTVTMPKLIGLNAAVARDQLDKLGFTDIQLGSQDTEDKVVILASNWTVTKQSTAAGAQVSTDTLIVLTCTKKA